MLGAVRRRYFTDAELAANGEAAPPLPPVPREPLGFEDERGPRSWNDAEIDALVARIRVAEGLSIVDRRHLLTVYPRCFVGREAVDWMTRAEGLTRAEAVAVGQLLVDRGIVHHVLDEHGFKDEKFFYRFRSDEAAHQNAAASRRSLIHEGERSGGCRPVCQSAHTHHLRSRCGSERVALLSAGELAWLASAT